MSDVSKREPLFEAREIIGVIGLASLAMGVSQIWWPLALIVIGAVMLAVSFGYLK